MIKKIIIFFIFTLSITTFAQNLTFGQLVQLRSKDFSDAEEFLVLNNWKFSKAYKPEEDFTKYGKKTHMSAQFGNENSSLFFYYDRNQPNFTRVFLMWENKIKYNNYIASIKSNGYRIVSSHVNNYNQIVKIYENSLHTIVITTSVSRNFSGEQNPSWQMLIVKSEDYLQNF